MTLEEKLQLAKEALKLHRTWEGMLARCNDFRVKHYRLYGGRGITVCQDWHTFDDFFCWAIQNGHSLDLSLDRINEQTGDSKVVYQGLRAYVVTPTGERLIADVVKEYKALHPESDIEPRTALKRLNRGWNLELALSRPKMSYRGSKK